MEGLGKVESATPRTRPTERYYWCDNEIVDHYSQQIGPYGLCVYNVLARYADLKTGICWISQKKIAARIHVSLRSVQRALHRLETARLLRIEHIRTRDGDWNHNQYQLLAIKGDKDGEGPAKRAGGTALKTGPHCRGGEDVLPDRHTFNTPGDSRLLDKKALIEAAAEETYRLYPKKTDRLAALSATRETLKRIIEEKDLDLSAATEYLQKAIKRYRIDCGGKDERYIKSCASWMKAGSYEDYDQLPARVSSAGDGLAEMRARRLAKAADSSDEPMSPNLRKFLEQKKDQGSRA